jgi:membrane protein/epoxyqueuosine reductase
MINRDFWRRLLAEVKNLFPLFKYLVLQTETHAFCLALAGAALLGFFPACLVMLAVFKNVLGWQGAYTTLLATVQSYFPTSQSAVVSGLEHSVAAFGSKSGIGPLLWVLLGAAGVFIPLETALNRLWKVQEDRPYWLNQVVGFTLTIVCVLLALFFLAISAVLHGIVSYFPFEVLRSVLSFLIIRVTMTCLFVVIIFALYKFLPNGKVDAAKVLPAAIVAGIMAEFVRVAYTHLVPNFTITQGPFTTSVIFLLLVYFETFVVLGCAFLATNTESYPWMGFLKRKRAEARPETAETFNTDPM